MGQEYITFNSSICLEIVVPSIDFGVKMIGFAFTPKVRAAGGVVSELENHLSPFSFIIG